MGLSSQLETKIKYITLKRKKIQSDIILVKKEN